MKSKIIIIKVDADNKIGMGHFYRTINLANELRKYHHKIFFLTTSTIVKKMLPSYYKCIFLQKNSVKNEIKKITKLPADIVIIDKHAEKTSIIKALQKNCKKIIGLDYTSSNKNLLSFSINMLYPKTGFNSKKTISGLELSILNDAFKKSKPIFIKKNVESILVVQGGSDTLCFVPQIINLLNNLETNYKITVVLGPSFKCWSKLDKALQKNKKSIKIFHKVKNMNHEMKKHDLAITGGGMTLLELCCLGIPSLVVCAEKFEEETAKLLERKGFGMNLEFNRILSKQRFLKVSNQLLSSYPLRRNMNTIGRNLVDGKGSERVSKLINELIEK